DRTGAINPGKFPISGAAIDPSDKTGKTAYVAIMGFHVAHVWKTSNGGVNWTNFTANLPDAPVNAILIDAGSTPSTGTIYVGTDNGIQRNGPCNQWIQQRGELDLQRGSNTSAFDLCDDAFQCDSDWDFQH